MAIKLKQFTAATNDGYPVFKFIATGLDITDLSIKKCLVADKNYASNSLYDEQLLNRLYSIASQQDSCTTPAAPLISITQFANNEFALTESTITPPKYDDIYDQHSIGIYESSGSQSVIAGPTTIIDKMSIISNNSTVFGYNISGSDYGIFVKNTNDSDKLAYSLSTAAPNICKNYIMENQLVALDNPSYILWAATSGSYVSGATSGEYVRVYVKDDSVDESSLEVYRKGDINNTDDLLYNFTPAKNIYNNNWELEVSNGQLDAIRDYSMIGTSNGSLYLKYKVYSGSSDSSITTDVSGTVSLYEYEMIERINGLYKLKSNDGHKSNVFSIRIENSGIRDLVDPTNVKYNEQLKNLLHDSVKKFVQKLIPANTQLWKIQFTGS